MLSPRMQAQISLGLAGLVLIASLSVLIAGRETGHRPDQADKTQVAANVQRQQEVVFNSPARSYAP